MNSTSLRIRTVAHELNEILRLLTCARSLCEGSPGLADLAVEEAGDRIAALRRHIANGGGILFTIAAVPHG